MRTELRRLGPSSALLSLGPAVAALALVGSGCVSMGNYAGTPDVLGKGELGGGVDLAALGTHGQGEPPELGVAVIGASLRYGLFEGGELGILYGGAAGGAGLTLLTKARLSDPEADLRVALAPSLGFFRTIEVQGRTDEEGQTPVYGGDTYLHTQIPVLVGYRVAEPVDLILAPKVGTWTLDGWSAGLTGGVAVGRSGFKVMPELSGSVPLSRGGLGTWEVALHLVLGPRDASWKASRPR